MTEDGCTTSMTPVHSAAWPGESGPSLYSSARSGPLRTSHCRPAGVLPCASHAPGLMPGLVVATVPGRGGTSTVAGALKMLGLHVPQPEIPRTTPIRAGTSSPSGPWRITRRCSPGGRPHARRSARGDRPMAAVTLRTRPAAELAVVRDQLQAPPDRRRRAPVRSGCASCGPGGLVARGQTIWLTMLRHPAEVVGSGICTTSRALARSAVGPGDQQLAGWVNVALTNERTSRGEPTSLRPLQRSHQPTGAPR